MSAKTLLIAALGGEGGGVLTGWIVAAAQACDLPVQATSIPGVAQRTGATTYYLEIWPETWTALGGRRAPVFALSPAPGEVDVLASTELLETGRQIQAGYVSPDRTLLIASSHRVFATAEKMQMGDGRADGKKLVQAAGERARGLVLFDMETAARDAGAHINAVLLGAIAGTGALPVPEDAFREAIRTEGKAVAANLAGFEAGLAAARGGLAAEDARPDDRYGAVRGAAPMLERARAGFPAAIHATLDHAVRRLIDWQDAGYAGLYLDRLAPFATGDADVLAAVARHLAVRMSYEDVIRVAQAKTRPGRFARIRAETGAGADDLVRVTEFLKPGLAEFCDVLPEKLAGFLLKRAEKSPRLANFQRGMELNSSTVAGFVKLRTLSGFRLWRRGTWRFRREQEAIESWLEAIRQATDMNAALAVEIAECARLIKGYSDTHRRGTANYAAIEAALIRPALSGGIDPGEAARRIAAAREAALADPEGDALSTALAAGGSPVAPKAQAAE